MVLTTLAAAAVLLVTVAVAVAFLATLPTRQQGHVRQARFRRDRGLNKATFRTVVGHKSLLRGVFGDDLAQRKIGAGFHSPGHAGHHFETQGLERISGTARAARMWLAPYNSAAHPAHRPERLQPIAVPDELHYATRPSSGG